jgi:hypothetical protein
MADRGFKISDDVAFYQAKLVIPDFILRGKNSSIPWKMRILEKLLMSAFMWNWLGYSAFLMGKFHRNFLS